MHQSSIVVYALILHHFFFFNDTATTEIYTLSLHDALPIYAEVITLAAASLLLAVVGCIDDIWPLSARVRIVLQTATVARSEEHTSELQSRQYLVCRLLLEKKKD